MTNHARSALRPVSGALCPVCVPRKQAGSSHPVGARLLTQLAVSPLGGAKGFPLAVRPEFATDSDTEHAGPGSRPAREEPPAPTFFGRSMTDRTGAPLSSRTATVSCHGLCSCPSAHAPPMRHLHRANAWRRLVAGSAVKRLPWCRASRDFFDLQQASLTLFRQHPQRRKPALRDAANRRADGRAVHSCGLRPPQRRPLAAHLHARNPKSRSSHILRCSSFGTAIHRMRLGRVMPTYTMRSSSLSLTVAPSCNRRA